MWQGLLERKEALAPAEALGVEGKIGSVDPNVCAGGTQDRRKPRVSQCKPDWIDSSRLRTPSSHSSPGS